MRIKRRGLWWIVLLCTLGLWKGNVKAAYQGMGYASCLGSGTKYGLSGYSTGPWIDCTTKALYAGAAIAADYILGDPIGYTPAGSEQFFPVLMACKGESGPGGALCPIGATGREIGVGASFRCVAGEPWVTCIGRATGSVEGAFIPGEQSACIMFRDQLGRYWGLTTTWGKCGTSQTPPSNPDNCTVTTTSNWDIPFGSVERMDIPTTGGIEQTKALTLACTGATAHDFSVKLNMTSTSWSTSQLATSNPDLGVQVTVGGVATKLGESFSMKVTGSGSKTLGFSVLRNPKTKALDIATGDFSASGTLVVSEL